MTASYVLQVVGLIVKIMGATVFGRAFVTRVHVWRVPVILLSALFGTAYAKSYANVAPAGEGRRDRTETLFDGLRGTALLWMGFLLQLAGVVMQWLSS